MAKLSGVKTLDMVNGEITKVEYNGAVYEKVDGKAHAGDLVLSNYSHPDITRGAFYAVVEDRDFFFDTLIDDAGDGHSNALKSSTAFRKVSETDKEFLLVTDRKPKAGDFAKLLATDEDGLTVGNYYEILGIDSDGDFRVNDDNGWETYIMESEGDKFEVYVKVTEDKTVEPLRVGDYAKVVDATAYHQLSNGDIVEIISNGLTSLSTSFSVKRLSDGTHQYVPKEELVRVTYEEAAEAKARWTTIGRKPNEFKKGDIVRVVKAGSHDFDEGDITEIISFDGLGPNKIRGNIESCPYLYEHEIELITPVEQRFDQ